MSVEHVERLRVAWIDTDACGRIHFSNAFRWAEAAEVGLIRGVLSVEDVLRFDDEIEVRIRVDRIGTTSITYGWTISKDGKPYVLGGHTVVHVDGDGRPSPVPDRIRDALSG